MAHEKIYCETADPTWHSSHPTDEVQTPDCQPGMTIQWHELGAVGVATGDLLLSNPNVDDPDDLPTVDLDAILGEPRDSDTAATHAALAEAVNAAVKRAYVRGIAVPRMVWLSRENLNHAIRVFRRGRNTCYGADE